MPYAGAPWAGLEELVGVVPIIPALEALWLLVPALLLSAVTALASLRHPQTAWKLVQLLWRQKLPLMLLATAIGLFGWLGTWTIARLGGSRAELAPSNVPPANVPPEHLPGADWPTARGSLLRQGALLRQGEMRSQGEPEQARGPIRGGVIWTSGKANEAFYSSPAIVGNRLYIVGSTGDRGTIHCLDQGSGERLWSCRPAGMRATFSSPTVQGHYLVCGEGLHHTRMARVICVDVRTGRVAWTFRTRSHVECTPVIAGNRVYVGAGDDGVYCLDLRPEIAEADRLIWHQPGSLFPDAETSLAVHRGRVYVGLGLGGEALCSLDADTGRQLARCDLPYPVFSPPAIAGDRLFVGMGNGDTITPQRTPAGQVACFEIPSLRALWTFPTPGTVLGAVAVMGQEIVFGCWDGRVVVLDRNGRIRGDWQSGAPIASSPAITRDHIYVVNRRGVLTGLRRDTLRPVWQHRLASRGRFLSSPTVGRGTVFVGTEFDGLMRVGKPAIDDRRPLWPGPLGGSGYAGCRDASRLPETIELAWTWTDKQQAEHRGLDLQDADLQGPDEQDADEPVSVRTALNLTAPVAASGDSLVVPVGGGPSRGLVCLDLSDTQSDAPRVRWRCAFPLGSHTSPALAGQSVYAIDGLPGDPGRHLHCRDLESGVERWTVPVASSATGVLTVDHQGIVMQDAPRRITQWDAQSKVLWTREVGRVESAVDMTASRLVVATVEPASLWMLDRPTGRVLWTVELSDRPTTNPVIDGDRVVLGTTAGLRILSLIDGALLAQTTSDVGRVSAPIYVGENRIIFATSASHVRIVRRSDARPVGEIEGLLAGTLPLVAGNGLLVVGEDALRVVGGPSGLEDVSRWTTRLLDGSPDGSPEGGGIEDLLRPHGITTPIVLHQERVYFGTAKHGLVCLKAKDQR